MFGWRESVNVGLVFNVKATLRLFFIVRVVNFEEVYDNERRGPLGVSSERNSSHGAP